MTNNDASYYCSKSGMKTGWLQYDFASPQQVKTYKIERLNGHGITWNQFSPVAWTFSGRNGNGAWHVLDTQSGHNSWADGEIKSFDTARPAPFSYWDLGAKPRGTHLEIRNGGKGAIRLPRILVHRTNTATNPLLSRLGLRGAHS